jgi:NAD(P)-dependent dehydrogenase (short-subunit alcohol dehydrogenase family)
MRVDRLAGKVAVIAGVLDETGHGIAQRFAQEGGQVAILAYPDQTTESIAKYAQAIHVGELGQMEVRTAIARIATQLGSVDILVNNVLRPPTLGPLESKTAKQFEAAFTDVRIAFGAIRAVFPYMRDRQWGRIINIGTRYGELMNVYIGEYNAAAWALRGLTRTAAAEWAKLGIVANVLEATTMGTEFAAYRSTNPEVVDALLCQLALGRRGDPVTDVGAAAAFLACDECALMFGQVIYADGGQHMAAPVFHPSTHLDFQPK